MEPNYWSRSTSGWLPCSRDSPARSDRGCATRRLGVMICKRMCTRTCSGFDPVEQGRRETSSADPAAGDAPAFNLRLHCLKRTRLARCIVDSRAWMAPCKWSRTIYGAWELFDQQTLNCRYVPGTEQILPPAYFWEKVIAGSRLDICRLDTSSPPHYSACFHSLTPNRILTNKYGMLAIFNDVRHRCPLCTTTLFIQQKLCRLQSCHSLRYSTHHHLASLDAHILNAGKNNEHGPTPRPEQPTHQPNPIIPTFEHSSAPSRLALSLGQSPY